MLINNDILAKETLGLDCKGASSGNAGKLVGQIVSGKEFTPCHHLKSCFKILLLQVGNRLLESICYVQEKNI